MNYFRLPWVPEKEKIIAPEIMLSPVQQGFNECRDQTAQQDWYLCEEEIKKVLQGMLSPNYMPGFTNTGHSLSIDDISKTIAAAGPRILKVSKS